MRTRVVLLIATGWWWLSTAPVGAQDEPAPPEIRAPDSCGGGGIIPDPTEGCAPETPGDPGGWQQLTLLAVILVALVVIGLLVRRQIRQANRLRDIGVGDDAS